MKKNYTLLLTLLVGFIPAISQVTLVSNNTNLYMGIVINNRALLLSENDSIWTTDGTPGGTVKLTDAVQINDTTGFAISLNHIFFTGITAGTGNELWITDGTTAGTVLLKDINPGPSGSVPDHFTLFNNEVYFFCQ